MRTVRNHCAWTAVSRAVPLYTPQGFSSQTKSLHTMLKLLQICVSVDYTYKMTLSKTRCRNLSCVLLEWDRSRVRLLLGTLQGTLNNWLTSTVCSGQLSLLSSAGCEMSISKSSVCYVVNAYSGWLGVGMWSRCTEGSTVPQRGYWMTT